ncbi:MAG: hypothetical protein PWR20_604 [Bacteroidales bacterium]|nr:hypothetical protein [Bacteroidales bacterium]MDN5328852.1 hypothetical protein [Bacteroidales bacterium]
MVAVRNYFLAMRNYRIVLISLLMHIVFYKGFGFNPKYIIGLQTSYINFKSGVLPNGMIYNIAPNHDTIWPGDTIGIQAGNRTTYLRIKNLRGTPSKPIIIINYGGKVVISNLNAGGAMSLKTCRNIILSGNGDPEWEFGIKLDTTASGTGLSLDELTSDVEVHNLEICRQGFAGIMAKTDPNCDPGTWRENFSLDNLHIHHCYIHHTQGEGMYIGFSVYGPVIRTCDGSSITVFAHEVKHVKIHDNRIEWTGLDGIQIGCATEDILVYNNQIIRTGFLDNSYSKHYGMEGICIGGGSTGYYFNNFISDTYGSGINVFGKENVMVFNNVIIRPGRPSKLPWYQHFAYGIFADDRTTTPGASFYYLSNSIISPRTSGIKIMSTQSKKNRIYDNVVVDPATKHQFGNYGNNWMQSCIQIKSGASVIISANYYDTVYYPSYHGLPGNLDPYFVDAVNGNFRLVNGTPLVDNGIAIDTVIGLSFDGDSLPRPEGSAWDIGAYEYHPQPSSPDNGNNEPPIYKHGNSLLNNDANDWRVVLTTEGVWIFPPDRKSFYRSAFYDLYGRQVGIWEKLTDVVILPRPEGLNNQFFLVVTEQAGKHHTAKLLCL